MRNKPQNFSPPCWKRLWFFLPPREPHSIIRPGRLEKEKLKEGVMRRSTKFSIGKMAGKSVGRIGKSKIDQ